MTPTREYFHPRIRFFFTRPEVAVKIIRVTNEREKEKEIKP